MFRQIVLIVWFSVLPSSQVTSVVPGVPGHVRQRNGNAMHHWSVTASVQLSPSVFRTAVAHEQPTDHAGRFAARIGRRRRRRRRARGTDCYLIIVLSHISFGIFSGDLSVSTEDAAITRVVKSLKRRASAFSVGQHSKKWRCFERKLSRLRWTHSKKRIFPRA